MHHYIKYSLCFALLFFTYQGMGQKQTKLKNNNTDAAPMTFDNQACENESYIQIENNKYYDGDEAFICTTPPAAELYAFQENGQALSELGTLSWEGATPATHIEENAATFEQSAVSTNLMGTSVSVSVGSVLITISIITVTITYSATDGMKYGFDDNIPANTSVYPSHTSTTPVAGLVWKSVKFGDEDDLAYTINPTIAGAAGRLMFKHGDAISLNPNTISSGMGTVQVKGEMVDKSTIYIQEDAAACYANTVTYNLKERTVGIVLVDTPGRPNEFVVNRGAIEKELNEVYAQAVFQWTVLDLGRETIAYDIDASGHLDTKIVSGSYSAELNHIIANSSKAMGCGTCHNIIFIVDNTVDTLPADTYSDRRKERIGGRNLNSQMYGFMWVDASIELGFPNVLPKNILGHELGHALGLKHGHDEFPVDRGYDPMNIMSWDTTTWAASPVGFSADGLLRKYQWDKIQGL